VACNDCLVRIDQYGIGKSELPDAAGDLMDLLFGMHPSIARPRTEHADGQVFDSKTGRRIWHDTFHRRSWPCQDEAAAVGVPSLNWQMANQDIVAVMETTVGRRCVSASLCGTGADPATNMTCRKVKDDSNISLLSKDISKSAKSRVGKGTCGLPAQWRRSPSLSLRRFVFERKRFAK
jgi:hypothetical protein